MLPYDCGQEKADLPAGSERVITGYQTWPKADEDLTRGVRWIHSNNPAAALRFLDCATNTFERLTRFPEAGPLAKFRHSRLSGVRLMVMPTPFNRWLIFYLVREEKIEIIRLIYGTQNWRGKPASFF